MRHLLIGLAVVSLSAPLFGQVAAQEKPALPALPPLPPPFPISPPPASAPELTAPGLELRFPHWREPVMKTEPLVRYGAERRVLNLNSGLIASAAAIPSHCSIPLLSIPLPEHFDDGMVRKMGPHLDDKMIIAPPPVCTLRGAFADKSKRK